MKENKQKSKTEKNIVSPSLSYLHGLTLKKFLKIKDCLLGVNNADIYEGPPFWKYSTTCEQIHWFTMLDRGNHLNLLKLENENFTHY